MEISAGNKDEKVRSDCHITITPNHGKGNTIHVVSKVEKLYGESIKKLALEILEFFEITNVNVEIKDSGALPFVIAARLEAALSQMNQTDRKFVYQLIEQNKKQTTKSISRRTRLYIPGNDPKLMINAGIYGADGIILDLEDSVSPDKKNEARILVRNALCQIDFYVAERMVRINQLPLGLDDLKFIVPVNPNLILIPKCERSEEVLQVENEIKKIAGKKDHGIFLMPIIESALGVENTFSIASASENIVALAIGLEDYTANIGVQRTVEGYESFYARTRIVNAAVAAGIQPIDSVFSEFENLDLLRENAQKSKSLGFVGMGCIHPAQINIVHEVFIPSEKEIEKAKKTVYAFYLAEKKGKSVVAVGSKMVDPPVVKRALKVIEDAIQNKKLDINWRDNYEA